MLDQRPFSLWAALLLALALLLGSGGPVAAEDSPRVVVGRVTRIDADSVMVGDQIGFLRTGSDIRSDGRAVAPTSIRVGMPAEMEIDVTGRILEVRIGSVAE